ncbi:hypothetical protein ACMD2_12042 [Ananas comosus]|uniref:Protein FAR1-RELATED SEQUENCE n=1 Tax=Ananas comosus TaxID=4615 RepID=A0A199UW98_ANACO|nr:hypothetical protein ACMD2_12042 [Ananas comosus]
MVKDIFSEDLVTNNVVTSPVSVAESQDEIDDHEGSSQHEPFIGQLLQNEEEVKRFYNLYAYKIGFSIRKATHYKAKKKKR